MASADDTSETSMDELIDMLQQSYDTNHMLVMRNQGEYTWIVHLCLAGTFAPADNDNTDRTCVYVHIAIQESSLLMDVLLCEESSTHKRALTPAIRNKFNTYIRDYTLKAALLDCMSAAKQWWAETGEDMYNQQMTNGRKSYLAKLRDDKKAPGKKVETKSQPAPVAEDTATSTGGMKTAQDVINRIQWDPLLPTDNFVIGYIDRFVGIVEKSFTTFNWDNFDEVDPDDCAIPRHRIVYFKYKTVKVWDRPERVDYVFGSVGNPKLTIQQIIEKEDAKTASTTSTAAKDEGEMASSDKRNIDEQPDELSAATNQFWAPLSLRVADVPAGRHPSHYLAIRLTSTEAVDAFNSEQQRIARIGGDQIDRLQPVSNMHMTLCIFCEEDLHDIGGIARVAYALRCARSVIDPIMSTACVRMRGLKVLRPYKVVVAQMAPANWVNEVLAAVAAEFHKQNIIFYMYAPTQLHLTLAKLRSVRDPREWQPLENVCNASQFTLTDRHPEFTLKQVGINNIDVELRDLPDPTNTEYTTADATNLIGVHVRNAHNFASWADVVYRAASVGVRAFAFFPVDKVVCEQVPMPDEKSVRAFVDACKKCSIDPGNIVPHGPYTLSPSSEHDALIRITVDTMINHMQLCHALGIRMYNVHAYTHGGLLAPGCAPSTPAAEQVNVADPLVFERFVSTAARTFNTVLKATDQLNVKILLETGAGQKGETCGRFEHLRAIIDRIDDKSRIGVCFDTCHVFSAGYGLATDDEYTATMHEFDKVIGRQYLCAFHVNDSKCERGCGRDHHASIGQGMIGARCFELLMNDSAFAHLPMILETPDLALNQQINDVLCLKRMCGKVVRNDALPKTITNKAPAAEVDNAFDHVAFSRQLYAHYDRLRERMSDISVKELCRQKLELHLKQTGFAKYTTSLHFIGGAMTRMGVKGSDLDLCLLVTQSQTINSYVIDWHTACAYLTKAQESIDRAVDLKRLLNITRTELRTGTVPILRLHIEDAHRPPTNVDINCNDMTSMRDAYLLRAYVDANPLVAPLCTLIKQWAGRHQINDALNGYPNNYSYILLAIHYMQVHNVIPNLQSTMPKYFADDHNIDTLYAQELPDMHPSKLVDGELSMHWRRMMRYLSTLPFETHWVSIRCAALLDRAHIPPSNSALNKYRTIIEDPYEKKNTARCLIDEQKVQQVNGLMLQAATSTDMSQLFP